MVQRATQQQAHTGTVYVDKPQPIDTLEPSIARVINGIPVDMLESIVYYVPRRTMRVIA